MSKMKFLLFSLIFTLSEISAQPTVTQITPNVGPARTAATPAITIQGTGFVDVTDVQIGGVSLGTSFTVVNDTTITVPAAALPQAVPGAVGITVTTTAGPSPDNHPFDYFTYQGDWLLYVPDFGTGEASQGFVYVFDITPSILADINNFTATPLVTLEVGDRSEMVVVSHDGAFAVCTNRASEDISVIDGAFNDQAHVVNTPIPDSKTGPMGIGISPGTDDIYLVADIFSAAVSQFTGSTHFTYTVNTHPTTAAFKPNPTNLLAFVPNDGNLITVIDPINKLTGNYTDGNLKDPCWVAPYPVTESEADYNYMVLNNLTGDVLFYSMDFDPGFAQTPFILSGVFTTMGGTDIKQILASPDSKTAYVTSNDGTVPRIDLTENPPALLTTILSVPVNTNGIALTPDGSIGFAANGLTGTTVNLTIFDTTTLETKSVHVINTLPTHFESFDLTKLCVTPDQAPVAYAVFRFLNDNTVQFDGSGSLSPTGKIAKWEWDFGDGSPLVNSPIPPPHTYTPRTAPYTVTLTVTNTAGTSTTQTHFGSMVYQNGGPPALFSFSLDVLPLLPPTNPHITQCVDRFLLQTCYENTITFSPPVNSIPPVAYLIYSDPQRRHLLEKIPASGPLKFTICEKMKHATYYLFSEDANGSISETYTTVCI